MDFTSVDTCQVKGLSDLYSQWLPPRGTFVEVGAYDGYKFSNTYGLAVLGWRGLYIEPVCEYAKKCRAYHAKHNAKVLTLAISNVIGMQWLQIDGALSHLTNEKTGWPVEVDVLDRVLLRENIPQGLELLVIDTEGNERRVLAGFSLDYWHPKMVIIETNIGSGGKDAEFIERYFKGYSRAYRDKINDIYVRLQDA